MSNIQYNNKETRKVQKQKKELAQILCRKKNNEAGSLDGK